MCRAIRKGFTSFPKTTFSRNNTFARRGIEFPTRMGGPDRWVTQGSSRHTAGSELSFLDGHVSYYKYAYVCSNAVTTAKDPGHADINWTASGVPAL